MMQSKAYGIALDKKVAGRWKLPENARVVAAGNELEDSLVANEMAEPLYDRFAHVNIETNAENWLEWAVTPESYYERLDYKKEDRSRQKIHPAIYAYISYKGDEVLRTPYNREHPEPHADPRRWKMASDMLYASNNPNTLKAIVGEDLTVDVTSDQVRAPSTMYVVLPGIVTAYEYHSNVSNNTTVPSSLSGIELARRIVDVANGDTVSTSDPEVYGNYFDLSPNYHGEVDKDYFMIDAVNGDSHTYYYYNVSESGNMCWSDPFFVTGEIPFAQEEVIGGFLNVPDTTLDGGYVYRDDTGHLRLLDYSLLRSGTLAYQLGEDFDIPSGVSSRTGCMRRSTYSERGSLHPHTAVAVSHPAHRRRYEAFRELGKHDPGIAPILRYPGRMGGRHSHAGYRAVCGVASRSRGLQHRESPVHHSFCRQQGEVGGGQFRGPQVFRNKRFRFRVGPSVYG